jgi:hypothetical protein
MATYRAMMDVPDDAVAISGDGGLCKRILTAGDPAEGTPFDGAEVQVHYVGTLLSDGSKFDSSRDRPGNFKFKIGKGQVIKGWDQGVATMHKGEVAELFCRADYAYGTSGSPPTIPGGATLKFEVELLSWAEPAKQRWELSSAEKLAKGRAFKAEGGSAFKAGDWSAARDKYASAVEWVSREDEFTKEADLREAAELHISCLLNAAQCTPCCARARVHVFICVVGCGYWIWAGSREGGRAAGLQACTWARALRAHAAPLRGRELCCGMCAQALSSSATGPRSSRAARVCSHHQRRGWVGCRRPRR